ncbi:hypothetical protein ACP70R_048050 [Stipagrostis hirtigluma subsp. patula]
MEPLCFAGFAGGLGGQQVSSVPLPVAWLQGDVLAEYLQFLEEAALLQQPRPAAAVTPGVEWLQGGRPGRVLAVPRRVAGRRGGRELRAAGEGGGWVRVRGARERGR